MFNTISNAYEFATDIEIIEAYSRDTNHCIAALYSRYRGYQSKLSEMVWISPEDKESLLLESIHRAVSTYAADRGAKFGTYLYKVYRNRIREANEHLMAKSKNRNWYISVIFASGSANEAEGNNTELLEVLSGGVEDNLEDFEMQQSLDTIQMTSNQRKYCDYVLSCSYTPTDGEVAAAIGVSRAGVKVLKQGLQKKLDSLLHPELT